ncbi:MAG: hypothetical protein COU10_03350 [Candidatus Harrisonbacteria bacterium CG10_big_fil_rev_8_21_14_0_10_45_28]|uniref:Cupin 2 conserved barrel domain-containing protein n=1 Tax=Candidatus Harrisonbacteria bacterium CG10_big_fil_rev_8_21_14_0_10_45_28 TaxID=1974586 RepID=A0A2H0UMQ3_9BACT|nr:MAG: hypothetical protein COU10_03350 [Candidatus Harrisonbacteria bacterium CG10_big_fil_rev_8_21_14_0_10_45_28]
MQIKRIEKTKQDHAEILKKGMPKDQPYTYNDFEKWVVPKPWGHEYLMYKSLAVEVWHLFIKNGESTSLHCHPRKKTAMILIDGIAKMRDLGGAVHDLVAPAGRIIDAGAFHQTIGVSEGGIHLLEVEVPPDKNDLIRLKDSYGRENKGYEKEKSVDIADGICIRFPNIMPISEEGRILNTNVCIHHIHGPMSQTQKDKIKHYDLVSILSGGVLSSHETHAPADLFTADEFVSDDTKIFDHAILLLLKKL